MLKAWVIELTQSKWASPILLISKPDRFKRFFIDYRRLNAVTVKDTSQIPLMKECIDSLGTEKLFSEIHCNNGYGKVLVAC